LALAASLLNPYGVDLLIETVEFGRNPNLKDILEWYSLKLIDAEGIQFASITLLWIALYRFSRQRVSMVDLMLLLVFGCGVAVAIRIVAWYAPLFALCMMPHVTDVGVRILNRWQQRFSLIQTAWAARPKLFYSLVCLLILWMRFCDITEGGATLGLPTSSTRAVIQPRNPKSYHRIPA
jgi:hypothetical protein